jgi:hypothetical protein
MAQTGPEASSNACLHIVGVTEVESGSMDPTAQLA